MWDFPPRDYSTVLATNIDPRKRPWLGPTPIQKVRIAAYLAGDWAGEALFGAGLGCGADDDGGGASV
jgi:hypothetical protein